MTVEQKLERCWIVGGKLRLNNVGVMLVFALIISHY